MMRSTVTSRRGPVRAWPLAARLLLVALLAGCAAHQQAANDQHRFQDAERWARVFDDPARDAWQKPDEVIRALKLPATAQVADIGSGTGYFAVRLARAVPQGRVYGADVEPDMVRHLEARARREGLSNLTAVQAAPDDPRLPNPVDAAIVVNTYHHIGNRVAYFGRLRGRLVSGGRVAIIDFRPDAPMGPPPAGRIAADHVKHEMARAGYRLAAEHPFLPHQYFLVFAPAP